MRTRRPTASRVPKGPSAPPAALLGLAALLLVAAAPAVAPAQLPLETDRDKALYAIGVLVGRQFRSLDLSEEEYRRVAEGVRDAALQREIRASMFEYQAEVEVLQEERRQRAIEKDLAITRAYLAEIAAQPDVERTASGLLIEHRSEGDGARPGPEDRVRVHYEGRLRDGAMFDSTHVRGAAAVFPLDSVISCWTEGLQLMRVGGRARIVCPPDLAYGRSAPPNIPPNAPLAFEVELLELVRE